MAVEEKVTPHLEEVRTYMQKHYEHDHCLRKGCEEPIAYPSGYCTEHHSEWIHTEQARSIRVT